MVGRMHLIVLGLLLALCAPALAQAEKEYLAVFMEGKKVGYGIHTRAVADGKVTTTEEVSITISRMGMPITVKMTETSVETTAGKPLRFQSVQDLGAMTMKVSGTVGSDGVVQVTSASLGMEQKSTIQWPAGAVMAEGLRLITIKHGLKPGVEYSASIFSPGVMQAINAKVTVGPRKQVDLLGRVRTLTEMTTLMNVPGAGQMTSISYVDDEMQALKNVMPIAGMQVEMISCTKEVALGGNEMLDLIDRMFVKSPESIDDLRSVSSITYLLHPGPGADFVIPSTDNQQAKRLPNGKIVLVVNPAAAPAGGTFPYKGNDPDLLEAVEPTRFLQSDHAEIVKLARQTTAGARDTAEAARRIESFVAEYITNKSLSVGYASAAEVVESRQGDCSEFAVLTAALCRAAGIPAEVVVGMAYVKEFAGIEGFGGHAWARAYVGGDKQGRGGRWIGLDAAFKSGGRGGYDPGHIALATGNGEPGAFFNMATALGQFTIEKLTIQRGN